MPEMQKVLVTGGAGFVWGFKKVYFKVNSAIVSGEAYAVR
jgi:hypothetical protein